MPSSAAPLSEPRAGDGEDDPLFVAELVHARDDYRALRHSAYRLRAFKLLRQLAASDPSTAWARMQTLVDVAAAGGTDGLQTLVLAHADALAHTAYSDHVASLLAANAESLTTRMQALPLNVLQPLGRASTRLVVNARGDAADAMLATLLGHPTRQDLDDLLADGGLQDDLCGLPSAGEVLGASEALAAADTKRQQACEEIAGGGMSGPTGLMVGMSADACLNVDISGARNTFGDNADGYGDDDRLADLEACADSLAGGGSQVAGSGMMNGAAIAQIVLEVLAEAWEAVKEVLTVVLEKGIEGVTELAKVAVEAYVKHLAAGANYQLELQKKSDTLGQEIAGLGAEISGLQGQIQGLAEDIADLQNKLDAFDENGMMLVDGEYRDHNSDGETYEQLRQQKKDKEKEKSDKEEELTETQQERETKQAVKEEVDRQKSDDNGLEPDLHPACERAMLGGKDWPTIKLGEDWLDAEARREIYSNPDPEAPPTVEPQDFLGLPSCGVDTTSSTLACNGLTHCTEGESCGCPSGIGAEPQSAAQAAALFGALASGCALTRCEDGEPRVRGSVCECTQYGEPTDLPSPPPPPFASAMVEAFFVQSDETPAYDGESSIGFAMDQIMRP